MIDIESPTARALRALQCYDEISDARNRFLIIAAESALGEELGLECTGEPEGWNDDDGSVAYFRHDGDTCPIHEWLVPDDATATHEKQRSYIYRGIE